MARSLGFCIGGTLLASAVAVQAARHERSVASVTLLTTMLDFADTGEIGLLVSEQAVAAREAAIGPRLDADPDQWFDAAEAIPGSWWPAWISWLAPHSGRRVAAPKQPGNAEFTPVEEAPGRYVKEKAS